jgi:hypothetical protein
MPNWTEGLAWLAVGEPNNPYPTEVLDCRAACAKLTLATEEQSESSAVSAFLSGAPQSSASAITESFDAACAIKIHASVCSAGQKSISPVVGHTWRFEILADSIVGRRRWTGQVVHIAEYDAVGEWILIKRVTSRRDLVYQNSDYAIAELEFLLRTYFEGVESAFPIPPGFQRRDTRKIALSGWKRHGSIAKFGRFL